MTERPSSSNKSHHKPVKQPETPNQKYNKAEILNICNKTNKKCFEDMVKHFEDKQNQSSIKSISAAGSSTSNKSSCSTRHSFHTIQSPGAKKPMRNCKSLNFEKSKQFSPIYNSGGGSNGGSTSGNRTHHTKSNDSKMNKNTSHINVYKIENAEKFDGAQSNCSNTNEDDDGDIVDFDDGNFIQVNMSTLGDYNAFEVNNENLCYHDKLKANTSPDDSLEKGVREESRLSGVKILLRGDILGAINCLLPQLSLMRSEKNRKIPKLDENFSLFSVNLKHCKDVIVKAREYRKQIFEINKTKNLHVIQEHEYNIEKQAILKAVEDSLCNVIDAKEIANADKIFENYKIPSQTFNQSSTASSVDNGKRNKSTCKCKTQTKHAQHHDGKKSQSVPSALVEENIKNNNLKLQQKCKKTNLANSHRDKRKQQAKKIIFTTFFKNSNLDKVADEKSVKNVWENSSAKFTKFTDSESSSVVTISEDEVHTEVCSSSTKSIKDEVIKVVEELSEKKTDYELTKKIMRQLQDWSNEKRKSDAPSTSKNNAACKQDQGKRTYSSVLKCSSAEKKTEKRKNSVKAKNKMTALAVNQKKENSKDNKNYVSPAAAVASAPAVLENSNETQQPEQTKIEKTIFVQSSSSATSINHEQQIKNSTTPVLDGNNNNNNNNSNNNHITVPSLLSDEDILLQLEKRIVYDLESILNACDDDDERFLQGHCDGKNVLAQSTASLSLSNNLKQYNQLIDQLNYTRLVQNMILPQFAAGYSAIANQYNYFWPMNNIMYSRNLIASYPQLVQHSIVINRNVPITNTAATATTINDTTKLEATLNELNSLKRNCQNTQLSDTEFRDVIMYRNKNFDSHANFNYGADELNTPNGNGAGGSKMILVSDLETEALEQYKHSDDSLNKKFDVLEKEAEEQYDGYE